MTDAHFLGDCFYGVYPLEIDFHLSEYYRTRITSVGPDQGTQCVFSEYVFDSPSLQSILMEYIG